jgi:hypothetical protein
MKAGRPAPRVLAAIGVGMIGPRALAYGKVAARRARSLRGLRS